MVLLQSKLKTVLKFVYFRNKKDNLLLFDLLVVLLLEIGNLNWLEINRFWIHGSLVVTCLTLILTMKTLDESNKVTVIIDNHIRTSGASKFPDNSSRIEQVELK